MSTKCEIKIFTNSADFRKCLAEDKRLMILDVYTEGWGPCVQMHPTFASLKMNIDGFDERCLLASIELKVDEEIKEKFFPTSMPRFLFYTNGECVDTIEMVDAPLILRTIDEHIPKLAQVEE